MANSLAEKACVPCRKGGQPMTDAEIREHLAELPDWDLVEEDERKLRRSYKLRNFRQALELTKRIGERAEEIDHHPVLVTEWGRLTVTWWTHHIKGLHMNDFIMAARSDEEFRAMQAAESGKE